jgi:hypothetical protein
LPLKETVPVVEDAYPADVAEEERASDVTSEIVYVAGVVAVTAPTLTFELFDETPPTARDRPKSPKSLTAFFNASAEV